MWQCPAADRRRRQRKTQNDDRRPSERVTRTHCSRRRRPEGVAVDDGETATAALGWRCAVTVVDTVAWWRNVELDGVRSVRRNPRLGQQQNVQLLSQQWHRASVQPCDRPTARSADPRMTTATYTDRDSARCRRVAAAEQRGRSTAIAEVGVDTRGRQLQKVDGRRQVGRELERRQWMDSAGRVCSYANLYVFSIKVTKQLVFSHNAVEFG